MPGLRWYYSGSMETRSGGRCTLAEYTPHQMTYDLQRLRLKGLVYRPPKTNRYFVTPYGWKVARLFSRLEARVSRPAGPLPVAGDRGCKSHRSGDETA